MSDEPQTDQLAQMKTKVRGDLDRYMADLDTQTEEFLAGDRSQIQFVTSYIDTWQHTRGKVVRLGWKVGRHLADQRDRYEDLMRRSKANGLPGTSGGLHYDERLSRYEIKHMEEGKKLRILDQLAEEISAVSWAYQNKISWLESMRHGMRKEDDDFRFSSTRDHRGS